MAIDLTKAREIIAKSERWNLDDKLERAFDEPLGEVFWALHRAGELDCSERDSWWNEMEEVEEVYTAQDAADLLLAASRHADFGGLLDEDDRRSGLAWNVYCRCFVKNKAADPAPLIAGYEKAPEPMKSPWGLELAALGLLSVDALPDDLLARVAPTAVREVGSQRWYSLLAEVYPVETYGPALMRAAATPGYRIWSLDFLQTSAPHGTPEDWAGLVLNIDYSDTVAKMLEWLEKSPEGVVDALATMIRSGRVDPDPDGEAARLRKLLNEPLEGDFGVATACVFAGRRARARGERLDSTWTQAAIDTAGWKNDTWKHLHEVWDLLEPAAAEAFVLDQMSGYWEPWLLAAGVPTEAVTRALVDKVKGYKQSHVNRPNPAIAPALAALAVACPEPFVEALSGKKLPAREFLVRALAEGTDEGAIPVLAKLLGDSKEVVREAALDGLVHRNAEAALTKAASSRKAVVKEAGEAGLSRLSAVEVPEDELPPDEARATVTEEQHELFEKAWRWREYREQSTTDLVDHFAAELGGALLVVAYDGLYRVRGTTTDKLALWHEVLERCPADARTCHFAIEMLAGWPLVITEGFDRSPERHRAAIEDGWARLQARFGEHVRPHVERLLDEADCAGLSAAWKVALDGGWEGLAGRVRALAGRTDGATLRFVMALDRLGEPAHAGLLEALADKKADVREAAARAILERPSPAFAKAVQRKDRAGSVRDVLARAGFAIASVDAPPLATDPDLDARLAAFPGDAPKKCDPKKLPHPCWSDGKELSDGALTWLLARMAAEGPDVEDPELRTVSGRLDGTTTSALWKAIRTAVKKERWAVFAGVHLGTDADMHALGDGLDDEARGGGAAQAFYKVETLRRHGSPAALTWLDHWSRNAKSQGLQARAEEALEAAADARGTTVDAIADEIVADFGLDAAGIRSFPYGSRTLDVVLAADGTVTYVRDDGKTVKSPPKALASEDAATVAAHRKAILAFKKQLGAAMGAAGERLEAAMVAGRRWDRAGFEATWGGHPLLAVLAREVWWADFSGDAPVPLRLRDGGLEHEDGAAWTGEGPLGVVHPLELDDATRARLPRTKPPFRQLGRPTAELQPGEADERQITRFEDAKTGTGRLRGLLERRRWRRGAPQDAGAVCWYVKHFPRADLTAQLELDPGFSIGGYDYGPSEQSVSAVLFSPGCYGRDGLPYKTKGEKLGTVDRVVLSEVLADLRALFT